MGLHAITERQRALFSKTEIHCRVMFASGVSGLSLRAKGVLILVFRVVNLTKSKVKTRLLFYNIVL